MTVLKSWIIITLQKEIDKSFNNTKLTNHLNYKKFCQQLYITECDPQIARVIFKTRTRMFDVKANFKTKYQGILHCPFARLMKNPWNIFLYVQIV